MSNPWYVYVLLSEDTRRTYVGITLDVTRRLLEHNNSSKGAKSTKGFRPWKVGKVYGPYPSRSAACKIEHLVKKLKGKKRLSYNETL